MKATSLRGSLQLISMQSSMESTRPTFWKTPEWSPILRVTLYSMGVASHECATLTVGFVVESAEIVDKWKDTTLRSSHYLSPGERVDGEGGRLVSQISIFKNLFFCKARYFGYVWLKQGAGWKGNLSSSGQALNIFETEIKTIWLKFISSGMLNFIIKRSKNM